MTKRFGKISILLFLFAALLIAINFWIANSQRASSPEDIDMSLFWEAWNLLEEKYVNQDNFNSQEMIYGAISGMANSLRDPYTVFLDPDEAKKFLEDAKGSFEGVGIEIALKDKQLQVIAPLEESPAQKAGIRAGDKIMEVDGEPIFNLSIDEIVSLIRGPKDTEVVLSVYRDDWQENREIKIIRQVIDVPSLRIEMLEDNIVYLKLNHFSQNASYDFNQAAVDILRGPGEKIILDLRDNPGGYLEVARDIAGWFLEKGDVVVTENFGQNKDKKEVLAEGNAKLLNYPLVVLINEGSASASEIVAGALRDNRGIKIVGQTSFGKGSVQELEILRGGAALKMTVAEWLTPKGNLIADKGLEPDIKVEMTLEDYENDRDPQLEKALELIKELD